jgi:putative oxidoreductase
MNLSSYEKYIPLAARVCLSLLFIISGSMMVTGFSGVSGMIASMGIPMAGIIAALVIITKVGGGLSVLTGYYSKWGSLALIVFCILTIVFVHNNMNDLTQALKNLAIIGGLLLVYKQSKE